MIMGASILFRSCAIPLARLPMLSTRWARKSFASVIHFRWTKSRLQRVLICPELVACLKSLARPPEAQAPVFASCFKDSMENRIPRSFLTDFDRCSGTAG